MAQTLTPVEFYFVAPNGDPVSNTAVSIQLAKGGFDEDVPGVIMPREILAVTGLDGHVTVALQPSETVYYVTVEDKVSEAALSYQFYVPTVDSPDEVIRLQDIIVDKAMSSKPYDEAALLLIHGVKASVLAHRAGAELAENNSELAQRASEAARDLALRTLPVTSLTAPLNPLPNQEWIHAETLHRYTWLIENGTGVWAEIGPVMLVETNDTDDSGGGFNAGALPTVSVLPVSTASLVLVNQGTAARIALGDASISLNDLPVAGSLSGTDTIIINQGGVDRQVSLSDLALYFNNIN